MSVLDDPYLGAMFYVYQMLLLVLLLCSGFIHGVMWAVAMVDKDGFVRPYRYQRSQGGIQMGTALIGVAITFFSFAYTTVVGIIHFVLFHSDMGRFNALSPIFICIYYCVILPPIAITAYTGVRMTMGLVRMMKKRSKQGTRQPGQLEAVAAQPLDIDMEVFVWSELRQIALKQRLHIYSELGGIVAGLPVGILMGSLYTLMTYVS